MGAARRAAGPMLLGPCLALALGCSPGGSLDEPIPPRPTALPAAAPGAVQPSFDAPTRTPPSTPTAEAPPPRRPSLPEPPEPDEEPEATTDAGQGMQL